MKVLKVIVDEMPEGCKRCRFAHDRGKLLRENESLTGNSHYCEITRKELYWDDWMNRHPECPLEKYCQICEGVGLVHHASNGIIPCTECNKESEDK